MGLAIALAPLQQTVGIESLIVSTLQAVSGAGRDGPSVLQLTDNVIPYIANEEDKIAEEFRRIFATPSGDHWQDLQTPVAAHCHRVPVIDGHLESVSIKLKAKLSIDEVKRLLREWEAHPASRGLPSSPKHPIWLSDAEDRPQPRLDRDTERGMAVTVGRIRPCPVFDFRLVLLSHNAIRGAAGAAILNAELAVKHNIVASTA